MDEFVKTKIIKSPTREQLEEGTHVFLCNFFEDLIELRRRLQKSLDYCFYDGLSRMPILHNTLRSITRRAEKMDSVLLKIIGDKEPVSKTDLMEKYGYPEVGLLTGNKSLEEILAAL